MSENIEIVVEGALTHAKELAKEMPSWQGGFACSVVRAIGLLQSENARLMAELEEKAAAFIPEAKKREYTSSLAERPNYARQGDSASGSHQSW
ncbi:hypothetical protein C0J08_14600 [Marinomonas sp. CT5]|uniref:hypothetical protein n=1 Tax=Marinomonas sp. CT5 TaxID=2066133 RepID=UPI001BB0D5E2|nr:hypothetical protein [Marinomonas sp. CT5]QUX96551.1 hypothetical protein C0J08_14600 [Marinomonas sp. CT5]